MLSQQTPKMKKQLNFFHHCGTVVIVKYNKDLDICYPYCPVCKEDFLFDDYPHLRQLKRTIEHDHNDLTLILDKPLANPHNCHHKEKNFVKRDELRKINIFRCIDCGSWIRERD